MSTYKAATVRGIPGNLSRIARARNLIDKAIARGQDVWMQTAEEFAQSVMQAFGDNHLISREALPIFIASELQARDAAVALAVLDELALLVQKVDANPNHKGLESYLIASRELRTKYAAKVSP